MNTLPVKSTVSDTEFIILENIYDSDKGEGSPGPLRQRALAQIAGASLGMTNSILKRLAHKGWITIKKLNSRNFQYAVTLEGINEIIRRSYRYFKKTIRNVVYFKDILEDTVIKALHKNIETVVLVGASDLDFIVEHACRRAGLSFKKLSGDQVIENQALVIYAEAFPPHKLTDKEAETPQNVFYLSHLIMKHAGLGGIE